MIVEMQGTQLAAFQAVKTLTERALRIVGRARCREVGLCRGGGRVGERWLGTRAVVQPKEVHRGADVLD